MNFELFIARRIHGTNGGMKKISPPAVRIAIISIALGLAIMILSVGIVIGFKQEVRGKIVGFGSHIQIKNFDSNTSYESHPIAVSNELIQRIKQHPNIRYIEKFATKPGIIKTDENYEGIILKGVDEDYDWDFFSRNLVEGTVLKITPDKNSTDVIISLPLAKSLELKTGDSFVTYFVEEQVRARKFTVAGIYQTNFSEYDKLFVLADIKQIRRLNNWEEDQVSGLEILVNDYDKLDDTTEELYFDLSVERDRLGNAYYIRSIKQLNPMIFSWLDLLDLNVIIILILMLAVAGFTMIAGLLIIILENSQLIGVLKALGQSNGSIRKIFLYLSVFLIGKGLLWGNIIGLFCCILQKYTGIFKLNPDIYYVAAVPIEINPFYIILLNAGTLICCLIILLGPSYLVSRISPSKTIRFE